jgi:ribulose 1,5-bisphosphate carboxylase large subunit-like protein
MCWQLLLSLVEELHQRGDPAGALAGDDAVLRQVRPQGVDQRGSLSRQQITGLVKHQHRLLIDALYRHEPHRRPGHFFADRFRVSGVGLPALHVWLYIGRRHQPDIMVQCQKLATPMVGRRASFHPDQARRQR